MTRRSPTSRANPARELNNGFVFGAALNPLAATFAGLYSELLEELRFSVGGTSA